MHIHGVREQQIMAVESSRKRLVANVRHMFPVVSRRAAWPLCYRLNAQLRSEAPAGGTQVGARSLNG